MPNYQVPVKVNVPATGTVEMEADSFAQAFTRVQADIHERGPESLAADAEFTTDWENQHGLTVDLDRALPQLAEPSDES